MIKDFLGKEIKVGDRVVYPGRAGSNLLMRQAVVTGIIYVSNYWNDRLFPVLQVVTPSGKKTHTSRIDRVVVVK